ncbi:hypothetical protein LX64_05166 [Chitinophaga skermanii]|uniref:Conjugative transposon TraK protein n=1 Tax=Chitinophaga skermanii TaxID=331697 RepID=A0A327PZX5_9BACT|nr:hypothetical protein [Chitinophaga skermanii]RAI97021.1 hypothetical protein LX64_05166 [Chitinophaga skermanii]
MKKSTVLSRFNEYSLSKKASTRNGLLFLAAFTFLVALVFIYATRIIQDAKNTIIVVDRGSGELLKSNVTYYNKLMISLIKNHCANTAYYLNSFDRYTLDQNMAKGLFLVNRPDAQKIFKKYKDQRGYGDALELGYVYQTEMVEVLELNTDKEPYKVRFKSILQIYEDHKVITRYTIVSDGEIRRSAAQWPENQNGLYFTSYEQTYQPLKIDENE